MVAEVSYEIALTWMPLDLTGDKSTLVQVMAWCRHRRNQAITWTNVDLSSVRRQATSHYLSQCWLRSMWPNGVTQWVNAHVYDTRNGKKRIPCYMKYLMVTIPCVCRKYIFVGNFRKVTMQSNKLQKLKWFYSYLYLMYSQHSFEIFYHVTDMIKWSKCYNWPIRKLYILLYT